MTIERDLYKEPALLATLRRLETPKLFWTTLFPSVFQSTKDSIEFARIGAKRHIAPFVRWQVEGQPTQGLREEALTFTPPAVKMKDPLSALEMTKVWGGLDELLKTRKLSGRQRKNALVALQLQNHKNMVVRLVEWMCAEIALKGKVVCKGDNYPAAEVDFKRPANHTVSLTGNDRWGESSSDIRGNLQQWSDRMEDSDWGSAPNRIVFGKKAWAAFQKDADMMKLLDKDVRMKHESIWEMGLRDSSKPYYHVGVLDGRYDLFVYSDWYHTAAGVKAFYMSENDVLLISNDFEGTVAYGAIPDIDAEFRPYPIHSKMWDEKDPSATQVLSQSAPLPITQNADSTLRATVTA